MLDTAFCILQPVASKVARSYGRNVERQKQFITNASHEMKTPVAIILALSLIHI